jgi:hypothetical protein
MNQLITERNTNFIPLAGAGRPRPFQTLQLKPDGRDSDFIPVDLQQDLPGNQPTIVVVMRETPD